MMKYLTLATILTFGIAATPATDDPLLARAGAINADLHSYTATMKAHVTLTSFPHMSADIVANVYHKDPDLNKIEVTSGLPIMASQFNHFVLQLEPPSQWDRLYAVTRESDYGVSTYKLVPKVPGNIDHIDAVINDSTALVTELTWTYANGGTAHIVNTYSKIDGSYVVTAQTGTVNEPSYQGKIDATLDDYKLNAAISDSTFAQ